MVRFFQKPDNSLAPAMSLFMKGKPNPYGDKLIRYQQAIYAEHLRKAKRAIVIGVSVNERDDHVWGKLADFPGKLYCFDPYPEGFDEWARRRRGRSMARTKSFRMGFQQTVNFLEKDYFLAKPGSTSF